VYDIISQFYLILIIFNMTKKTLFIFCCLLLVLSCIPVFAQENSVSGKTQSAKIKVQPAPSEGEGGEPTAVPAPDLIIDGTAVENVKVEAVKVETDPFAPPTVTGAGISQDENGMRWKIKNEIQVKAKNLNELKQLKEQRTLELQTELQELPTVVQNVFQNQNVVREAVHTLLSAENLVGKLGPQISAIAKEFNNSVSSTIRAEEKIQKRSQVIKFFVGGDKDAAQTLRTALDQNKEKLTELKKLKDDCNCAEEVKNVVQEQVQKIEQEQTRLQNVAENEVSKKGVFGWFLKWFKK